MGEAVIIEVKQEDIEAGIECNSHRCPIAIAIQRATGAHTVQVFGREAVINFKSYALPDECDAFAQVCDTLGRNRCAPFSFELPEKANDE